MNKEHLEPVPQKEFWSEIELWPSSPLLFFSKSPLLLDLCYPPYSLKSHPNADIHYEKKEYLQPCTIGPKTRAQNIPSCHPEQKKITHDILLARGMSGGLQKWSRKGVFFFFLSKIFYLVLPFSLIIELPKAPRARLFRLF